jgi:large subunit ribosomal protein L4
MTMATVKETKSVKAKPVQKEVKAPKKVESFLVVDVYDHLGKVVGQEDLSKEIFDHAASKQLLAQAIRVLTFNQRQGTAKAKGRAEVRGGGRKPWRQKGTGRARQGSIRSPQWRGGGVIHNPEPKDWSLDLSKRQRRNALLGSLTQKAKDKEIVLIKDLTIKDGKTKEISTILAKLPLLNHKTLVVLPQKDDLVLRSVRNLPNASVETVSNLNTLQVISAAKLLLTPKTITTMKENYLKEVSKK